MAERLEPRVLLALVEWDGGAGTDSWHDALNWSGDELPTAADDVVIGETGLGEIRVFGTAQVLSLTTAENLIVRGGITVTDRVDLNARLTLGDGASTGSLGFANGQDGIIDGNGEIVFNYAGAGVGSRVSVSGWLRSLTIGEGIIIRGGGGGVLPSGGHLELLGNVRADVPGQRIQVSGPYIQTSVTVHGLLESAGGTLELTAETISFEDSGSIINAGGFFEIKGLVQNTGRTFTLPAASGDIHITWGGFVGGIVRSKGLGGFRIDGARGSNVIAGLDGVHLEAPMWVYNNAELRILNGLTLDSSLTLGIGSNSGTGAGRIVFWNTTPNQVLAGSGEVIFNQLVGHRPEMVNNYLAAAYQVQLTIEEGITLRGRGGMIWAELNAVITTHATISANVPGNFYVGQAWQRGMIVNHGRLDASNGGILDVGPYPSTSVMFGEGTSFTADDGRIQVRGLNIQAGEPIFFDAEVGTLEISYSTIVGSEISSRGGTVAFGNESDLDGVVLNVPTEIIGLTRVRNGLTLNAPLSFVYQPLYNVLGGMNFVETAQQFLNGETTLTLSQSSGFFYGITAESGVALTIGAGIAIRGGGGPIKALSGASIIHFGMIDAATAGKTIQLIGDITHHGVMRIVAGATIARTGTWVMQEGASLQVEIAGTANNQMGRLTATGAITLNGAVEVSYAAGFVPLRGQSFRFVTSAGRTGAFDSITTPPLSDTDLKSPVLVDAQGVRMIVTHIADFNNDLTVNEADIFAFLTAWFAGNGDFDGDGTTSVPDIFVFLSAWFRA